MLVVCPTARDRVHFARPEIRDAYELVQYGSDEATHEPGFDVGRFLDSLLRHAQRASRPYRAVVGIDDFPACMVAALAGERLGLPAPSFRALFLCQHKFYSRRCQQAAAPAATPRFHLLDPQGVPDDLPFPLPAFVKPVKSYLSILARPVRSLEDLRHVAAATGGRLGPVAAMFDRLVEGSAVEAALRQVPASWLLLEDLLSGRQVTLDGYVFRGEVVPLGVTDSHFYPGTGSFERFEYPSRLPAEVQERMAEIAEACIRRIGLDRTFFNVEFFYRESDDGIWIIEINGRMASQFAPLYRMVEGIDLYAMQLDLALGRDPGGRRVWRPGRGRRGVAASFVLRRFQDALVLRVPVAAELARLRARFPEAFVEILASAGKRLSDELQDDESFRYALLDLCAGTRKALLARFREARGLLPFAFGPAGPG
ncbi:MAG: acetyl-CoA carboxylase biotin carboxylase subunit family protein [Candidatus Methylomirabilales bacterium]